MPILETSLSAGYQPDWGVKHAIREIVSNAIDGEARGASSFEPTGQMEVNYYPRTERLLVTNADTKVPASALLMGKSENRSYGECIGTFGEGLPMALLVLSRMHFKVTIINGDEKWEPMLRRSDTYGEDVLAIKTRQLRSDKGLFSVEVEGISPSMWEEYRRMFLRLHPEYDVSQTGKSLVRGSSVLFQPEMRGKVFNKGVLVTERDDLALGYDFNVNLNRDRDFLDGYNIQMNAGNLLAELFDNITEEVADERFEQLRGKEEAYELDNSYGPLTESKGFTEAARRWWKRTRAADAEAMAVTDKSEERKMEKYGFKTVRVSSAVASAIQVGSETENAIEGKRRDAMETHALASLLPEEREVLLRAVKATKPIRPANRSGRVSVVTFRGDTIKGHYCEKDGQHSYQIARHSLQHETYAVNALVQAIVVSDMVSRGEKSLQRSSYHHIQMTALTRVLLANAN